MQRNGHKTIKKSLGGSIALPQPTKPTGRPKGLPMNPVTKMKMQNGVPGFKSGGKCK